MFDHLNCTVAVDAATDAGVAGTGVRVFPQKGLS